MPFLAPAFAAVAAVSAAGGIGGFLLATAGSMALSAIGRKLARRKAPATSNIGWGTAATLNETLVARRIIYGSVRTAGAKIFENSSSGQHGPTSVLDLIIVVAGHVVDQIGAIYLDGELAVPAGSSTGTGRYAGYVHVERALGDDGQRAFPGLAADLPALWTSAHQMRGVAGIRLRLIYEKERGADIFPTGRPAVTVDVRGKSDVLDPRTGNRSWTDNAALCAADYCAMAAPVGFGAAIGAEDGVVTSELIEAANICDEAVALSDGSIQTRYTCNGVIDTSLTRQQIIRDLVGAMAGQFVPMGGAIILRAGAYRIPSATFDLSEARGDITLTTLTEETDNCNGVRTKYVAAANDWQVDDAPVIRSSTYLAEDQGVERYLDIELPFTTAPERALRIARIEMERRRRQISVEWPGMLSSWRAAADDTVALTVPSLGWSAKPFEVEAVTLAVETDANDLPMIVPNFVLRETSPLIYDTDASALQIYASAPRTTLPSPFAAEVPGVPMLTEALYETRAAGGVKVMLSVEWAEARSGMVASYDLRAKGPEQIVRSQTGIKGTMTEILDVTPGDWTVELRAVTTFGVRSSWVSAATRVQGLSIPPTALTGASIGSAGGLAILRWDQSTDLDVRIGGKIVIRHSSAVSPSWAASITWASLPGSATLAAGELLTGAYLLRAADSAGNLGPETVLYSDGATLTRFSTIGMLQEDDEFSGTHIGTLVRGGQLAISAAQSLRDVADLRAATSMIYPGGESSPSGTYDFASILDLGSVQTTRLRRVIDLLTLPVDDNVRTRAAPARAWENFRGLGAAAGDAIVEIQSSVDDPAIAPRWTEWRTLTSEEITTRAVRARIVLTTTDPAYSPNVSRLRIIADGVTQ